MRIASLGTVGALIGAMAGTGAAPAAATVTASVDNYRTGWDQAEPGLAPASVVSSDFGQLFLPQQLDGQIYAQPITAGSTLIVATENNKVYGMAPDTGAIQWTRDLGPAWAVAPNLVCGDLAPTFGVTSTPVYDPASNSVYLTSKVNDGVDTMHPSWYMHALDPATGLDRPGWPVKMQGSPSNYPSRTFDPLYEAQRPGLLLLGGVVYAGFGSICDLGPFRGYIVGVDTATAKQTTMWTTENSGAYSGGGIWEGGGGLVSDGPGQIIFSSGNGVSPAAGPGTSPPGALAESVVRLHVNSDKSLTAVDFFSPWDASNLDLNDTDLGSGGPVALPDSLGTTAVPHLLVEQGKDGRVFLLNRDNLGGRGQGPGGKDAALSVLGPYAGLWGHPAVWGGDGGYIYTIGSAGPLRALKLGQDGQGNPSLSMAGTSALQQFGYSSGSPIVTSDGTTSGSAVVWVVYSTGSLGNNSELQAYGAIPDSSGTLPLLGHWPIGTAAKFVIPGTDSNRVFVGTRDGKVLGFGRPAASVLNGPAVDFGKAEVGGAPVSGTVKLTASANVTINSISTTSPMFTASPPTLPIVLTAGASVSIPVVFKPTAPGSTTAILTAVANTGTYGVALNGTGTKVGLGATPSSLAFSTSQPTGTSTTMAVRINNTGTAPETVASTTAPSAPFTASGLPAAGTVIQPGSGVDVNVAYAPAAAGPASDAITVTTGSGTLTIPLTGTAIVAQPQVTILPLTLDFQDVLVGSSKTLSFTVSNTGNVSLTITKAKAPVGVFSTDAPMGEGIVVGVGASLTQTVTFAPTAAGPQSSTYEISTDTGQGAMYVTLTGNGTVTPPPPPPPPVGGNPLVTRLSGNDRYLTGVQVSKAQWADAAGDSTGRPAAQEVVLARGDQFPDALAGVPLAAHVHGPLLLTDPKALTQSTENEILRVLPRGGTVDILGGAGAVSDAVAQRLTALGYHVNRYQGSDRFGTALDIARRGLGDPAHVIVATGLDYADALAAGPFAAGPASSGGVPAAILLTNGDVMDSATAAYVKAKAAGSTPTSPTVYAIGGHAATAAQGVGGFVQDYSGSDRYQTDAKVVAAFAAATTLTHIGIATGGGFADALTGGAFTATQGGAMVIIPSALGPQNTLLLNALAPRLVGVTMFGGLAAISPGAAGQIVTAVNGRVS